MNKPMAKGLVPELRFPEFKDDCVWKIVLLSDISDIKGGKRIPKGYSLTEENTGLPYIRITDMHMGGVNSSSVLFITKEIEQQIKNYKISKCDLFITVAGTIGIVGEIPDELDNANLTENANKIIVKSANKKYLLHYLSSEKLQNKIKSSITNNAQPKLSLERIRSFSIPFPKLEEQQKIADCLSSLDELISAHSQKCDGLKAHKKGLMQQLFPAQGETVPKLRFPEFKGEWNISTLGKIASVSSGGTPSRTMPSYWKGDIPWVSTTLIDFNRIGAVNESITELGLNNSSAKVFPKGTILIAMYGQGKTRGKVAILDIKASINQACGAISLCKGMNIDFVFQNLASRYSEIRDISNQGGQENLSAGLIKEIPFRYPDIESGEQQKIADCLSSLDELITAQNHKIDVLKAHKKGLMQQLFPTVEVNA